MAAGFKKISYTDEKQIRLDNYPNPIAFYYSNNTNYEQMYKSIIESFNGKIMTSMENNISSGKFSFSIYIFTKNKILLNLKLIISFSIT